MSSKWAESYMTLSFRDGGRDFPAVDCWGLVRLVLAREAGIALPTYGDISARDLMKVAHEMGSAQRAGPWRPVTGLCRALDVAAMRANPTATGPRRAVVHVGVLTGPDRLMHIEEGSGVHHVAVSHRAVRPRIVGYWRHEALA